MSLQFPLSWFFIKNNNGLVITASKNEDGANVVIATLRNNDPNSQLWRHEGDGRLVNKESGLVMDVAKGSLKAGAEIIQAKNESPQKFEISKDGHICVQGKPSLVLGIKESFFSRNEGLHVHLQAASKRSKEQHWNFVLPVVKSSSTASSAQLKRSSSSSTVGSNAAAVGAKPISKGISQIKEDDARSVVSSSTSSSLGQDENHSLPAGTFPDTPFFLKSKSTELFIGVEAATMSQTGGRIVIDKLRKSGGYDSQLWTYEKSTGHIINKHSGMVLDLESLKDDAYACQSKPRDGNKHQEWTLSVDNEVCLKHDKTWVLGIKESWFSTAREGAHIHIQKKTKLQDSQRFTIVLPIYKKKTVEQASEQQGTFPDGWFFVKNQATGDIVTATDDLDITVGKLDTSNYSRQLWRYKNGFLINKASGKVLDVRGDDITSGAAICHYDQKKKHNENQMWALTSEGFIYVQSHASLVISVKERDGKSYIHLGDKSSTENKAQRWNFVLPVFKKKQDTSRAVTTTTTTKTIKKTITYRYAQYPSGWFFIKSYVKHSTKEEPLVLTAIKESNSIAIAALDRENWQTQLWTYVDGALINYANHLAIDVSNVTEGSSLKLAEKESKPRRQRWMLTIDGHLVNSMEQTLVLAPQAAEQDGKYNLLMVDHRTYEQEHSWGLLLPEMSTQNQMQILVRWTIAHLKEWSAKSSNMRTVSQLAYWPEDEFIISDADGYALAPQKAEAYSHVTLTRMEGADAENFKWKYDGGYLLHVATGLVLHADDRLHHGCKLILRSKLIDGNKADDRQLWTLKTNGSIVSSSYHYIGLAFVRHGEGYSVELCDYKKYRKQHYDWTLSYGKYERRYSEIHKREILVIITLYKIILNWRNASSKTASSTTHKLVTQKYGIFPKDPFFIRSKHDKSLVVTAKSTSQGEKLVLEKIDYKNYKKQLWTSDPSDGSLDNVGTKLVMDVAGGKLMPGCNVIQYHEKHMWRSRKNQQWGLSVEGHIHPLSRPSLALSPKDNEAKEGATLQLQKRGALSADYQQWTFAVPVFGKSQHGSISRSSTIIEEVGDASLEYADRERYERVEKRTIVRRWGVFPSGELFIRIRHGAERLALTVEKQDGQDIKEYPVTVRALNFKEYKWQLWRYEEGHLINVQTGLALDSAAVREVLLEYGLKTQLFVRAISEEESQYWSLGVDGEIHLRGDERMVVGVAAEERASVAGAQVGLRQLRVSKTEQDGKQQVALHSDAWLRWGFSKPIYGIVSTSQVAEIKETEEQQITVEECDESDNESDDESDYEEDDDASTVYDTDTDSVASLDVTSSVGRNKLKETLSSSTRSVKSNSSRSSRSSRKDSFTSSNDYVPTGFERVVRYKTHHGSFPTAGYFIIKNDLHGYVLDIDGNPNDGSNIVLSPLRSTDFASQLWSFRDGFLVNLKGQTLVLDASESDNLTAGERLHLSTRSGSSADDQQWEYSSEGLVYLRAKRTLVISLKELKRGSYNKIDVFVQEEKTHGNLKNGARPEQRWEILVPSLIPVEKKESGVKIIEAGKKVVSSPTTTTATAAAAAVVTSMFTMRWLREALRYKITAHDAWPTSQCFFIRMGADNAFLAAGTQKGEVGVYVLDDKVDYKRFLWVYIDGYLVNYKYMQRLVYIVKTRRWILSDANDTAEQTCHISTNGLLTIRIRTTIYYLRIVRHAAGHFELDVTEDEKSAQSATDSLLELHTPTFANKSHEDDVKAFYTAASTYAAKQKLTAYKTMTLTVQRAIFPANDCFFVKVDDDKNSDLVLAASKAAPGASLSVQKISYTNFRTQLWTFRDGLLYNYGTQMVMSIQGGIAPWAKIGLHLKTTASLKWFLTADGMIRLQGYPGLSLGFRTDKLVNETALVLAPVADTTEHAIRWKFAVPVFGKKKVATATGSSSTTTEVATAVGQQHHHQSVSATKASAEIDLQLDTVDEVHAEIDNTTTTTTTEESSKIVKNVVISAEIWTITLRWRMYLIRRLRQCKTKAELVATIEECKRVLYRGLDNEHGAANLDVVEHVKHVLHLQVFEAILSKVKSHKDNDTISFEELGIQSIIDNTYGEIQSSVDKESCKELGLIDTTTQVISKKEESRYAKEQVLVGVTTISITVRYWLVSLRKKLIQAKKNGASDQELKKIVEQEHQQLKTDIDTTRTSVQSSESWKLVDTAVHGSVTTVFDHIDKQVQQIVSTTSFEEQHLVSLIEESENSVVTQVEGCQHAILSHDEQEQDDKTIVVVEKAEKEAILDHVSTELAETKTRITSWYAHLVREITSCYEDKEQQPNAKENVLVITESAQITLIGMLEEVKLSLRKQSVGLSAIERRRIEYQIETIRAGIIAYLLRFKRFAETENVTDESVHKYLKLSFGSTERLDVVEQFDQVMYKIDDRKKTEQHSGKIVHGHKDTIKAGAAVAAGAVTIAVVAEEIRGYVVDWFSRLNRRVSDRIKQGGENVQQDVDVIVAEAQSELKHHVDTKKQACAHLTTTTAEETVSFEQAFGWIETTTGYHTEQLKTIATKTEDVKIVEQELTKLSENAVQQVNDTTDKCKAGVIITSDDISKIVQSKESTHVDVIRNDKQAVAFIEETTTTVYTWFSGIITRLSKQGAKVEDIEASEQELTVIIDQAKAKLEDDSKFERRTYYIEALEALRAKATIHFKEVKQIAVSQDTTVVAKLENVASSFKQETIIHCDRVKKGDTITIIADSHEDTKKPEHHEKEHHHSKIGIAAGIGGAIVAGAAGAAIASHHHHDKKEEDKHQSEEVVHKDTGVVAEHKHTDVEKTKVEADVEKTKIDSGKKTAIEKVTTETSAGAIAVGKVEKTTEAGKQTAEVDTGKKVSEHDHTVGKVVAGTVVTGGVIAIGAATHVKNTISSWLAKLKTDVADCVEQGGDQKQVEAIVAKANADIEIQLQETYKKTETTDVSKTVKEQLIASTELAKKTALKSSAQVQAVTVEVVSSGKATGASVKERIDTIIKSSEQEVHTELEKVDSGLVIEVEHKDSEVQVTKPVHKIEETKTEVIKEEVHVKPADDHHVGKVVAGTIVGSGVVAVGAATYVKSSVSSWLTKLKDDVAACIQRGGDQKEVETIVAEANAKIETELKETCKKAESSGASAVVKEQIIASTELTKKTVLESTAQVQAIGVEIITTGGSSVDTLKDRLTGVIESTEKKVHEHVGKVDTSVEIEVEHQKINEIVKHDQGTKIVVGETQAIATVGVVEYVKTTISSWLAKLKSDVATCVEQGGDETQVQAIISKANVEIESQLKSTCDKTKNTGVSSTVKEQIIASTEWAKKTALESSAQVQTVSVEVINAGGDKSATVVEERLAGLIESTKEKVHTELDKCDSAVQVDVEKTKISIVKPTHEVKKPVEEHHEKEHHHSKIGIAAGIGGAIVAGAAGAAIAHHHHDKKEEDKHQSEEVVHKNTDVVTEHKQTEVEKTKVEADVEKTKIESGKKTDIEKVTTETSAGAIAVGKVEKTTEAGKQTAEVDTGKKVSEHDHTVGKVVAGTVVTGGVIAIGAATHVKNTISSWLAKLKTDVADCVEQGGDQKQVEAIVAKANADIEIQLQETYKKTETTDVSKTVKEQLIASTELAKKTALKSSAQVQAVTVEVVSSGKATGASVKERIDTIIKSSEQEVHTELEKIDSGLVIEVEHKDSEVQVTKPVHKIEEVKTEVIKEEAHVHKDSKDETIVKKPVEEHHEKEHHHSKIGIIAGIGGAIAAGAAGAAIASHHHHDKKEEDKHKDHHSQDHVHKDTGVVAEHKHTEVEKTKIESDKKTDIEKVTTGAGAIAVGKVEKSTETGKQTAEVDTGKKVSEHDHTVGKVVAGTVVTGGVIAIGAATHVKNTISSWLAKLKSDVANCVEQGGDQKQVEAIVAKANADIEIQLQETYKKTETTDVSKTVKEQLIASTELAKKTALKSSAQVQAVTVEVVSSGKATGASVKERIDTIIKSSEQEVHTELEKVDSGLVIEVEHKEADIEVTKPVHKIEETKTEVIKEEVHVKPADDHHVGKIVAGTIVGSGVVAVGAATYVKSSVSSWLTKLKDDVAACIQRGGDQKEVETIVAEANAKIETELKETCKKAESSGASAVVKEQIIASTELTKKTVLESTAQVQAIGVEIITTGGSSVDTLKDRLTGVIESTEKKVHEHVGKVDTSVEIEVEHQKATEVIKHIQDKQQHVTGEVATAVVTIGVVEHVKTTVISWLAKLKSDVATCIEQGGSEKDIQAIVSKANAEIDVQLKNTCYKTNDSNASATVKEQIITTTEWAKKTVLESSTQIQTVGIDVITAGGNKNATFVEERLAGLIESTKEKVHTELDKCDSSVQVDFEKTEISIVKPTHDHKIKKPVEEHHEKEHHHSKIGIVAGIGGAIAAGAAGAAIASHHHHDKKEEDKHKDHHSQDHVHKDTGVVAEHKHTEVEKTKIESDKKTDVEKVTTGAGAIAVGKVEKSTETGKQTAEVDTGKKVSEHDHTVGKVVAGTVVTGGVIAIGAATHVKNTISSWLAKLKSDVANCVEQGGDQKQVEAIVAKANADIEIQLQETYKKTETTDVSKTVKEQLIASTELAKKTALKSSAQVQAVTVEVVSSGKATGASVKERIDTIIKSSEQEVHTELEKVDSGLVIEVEHKEADIEVTKPVHKIEETKTEVIKEEVHVKPADDHHVGKIVAGTIVGSGVVAVGAATYVKSSVSSWLTKLKDDVAACIQRGGDQKEVETIVAEANAKIETELKETCKKAESSGASAVVKEQIIASTELTKKTVLESTAQVQAIGVEIITTGGSSVDTLKDRLTGVIESTEKKVHEHVDKVDTSVEIEVEHQKINEIVKHDQGTKIVVGETQAIATVGVVEYVKTTISSWLAKLKSDVATCVEQGGDETQVQAIISKANVEIESQLKSTCDKTKNTGVSSTVKEQIIASTEWAKKTALESSAQVQTVSVEVINAGGDKSATVVEERLAGLIESTKEKVHTELDKCDSAVQVDVEKTKISIVKPTHEVKKPVEEHHEKEHHHSKIGIAAGIGGAIVAGAAGAAIASHHHHDKKEEDKHQSEEVVHKDTGVVAEHKHTDVEKTKVEADVEKTKIDSGKKTAIEKVTTETSAGAIAVGKVEKTTEAGKQTAEVDTGKKVSEHDHTVGKVVAGTVVTGGVIAIGAATHVKNTISSWLAKLKTDVADCVEQGGDQKQVEAIVAKANADIEIQLQETYKKTETTDVSKTVKEQLIASTELAKKTALKSSAQVQAVTVEVVSSGKATGASVKERIDTIIKSSEQEVHTELEKIDSGLVIEVEHKDSEVQVTKPVHKIEEVKTEVIKEEAHVHKDSKDETIVKKPVEEHHEKEHHHSKIGIIAGIGGAVAAGAAGVAIAAHHHHDKKEEDKHKDHHSQGHVHKDTGVVAEHKHTEVEKTKIEADVEKTKIESGKKTAIEKVTTGAGAIAVGKVEKTTEAGKQTAEVDTGKKVSEHDHTVGKVVAGTVVTGGVIAIGAATHVKNTISSWLAKLKTDVADCVEQGGDQKQVEAIVAKANADIEIQLQETYKKTETTDVSKTVKEQLIASTELAKKTALKSSAQVQAVTVEVVSSGKATGASVKERIDTIIKSSEQEVHTELEKVDSGLVIEVEHKEADIEVTKPVHKIEETKTEVIKEEVHVKPADDHHVGKIVAGTIVGSGVVAVGAATYVKSSVSSWLTKLKDDVAACIQRGGDQKEVETIVAEANAKIETELKETCKKAESSGVSAVVKEQIIASTELTKKTVLESTAQVQAIGVEIITTGGSSVDTLKDRLTGVIESTEKKVHEHVGKVDTSVEIEVEHQKATEVIKHDQGTKIVVGETQAIATVGVVEYVKTTISSWLAKLKSDVATCVEQGGDETQVQAIISKANVEIESQLKSTCDKTKNTEVSSTVKEQIIASTEWAKKTALESSAQVQTVSVEVINAGGDKSATVVEERLAGLIESTKEKVHTELDKCDSAVQVDGEKTKISIVKPTHEVKKPVEEHHDKEHHHSKIGIIAGIGGAVAAGAAGVAIAAHHHHDKKEEDKHKDHHSQDHVHKDTGVVAEHKHTEVEKNKIESDKKTDVENVTTGAGAIAVGKVEKITETETGKQTAEVDTGKKVSEHDHTVGKVVAGTVVTGGVIAIGAATHVKNTISSWLAKLKSDVANCVEQGGDQKQVEAIVAKANADIEIQLQETYKKTETTDVSKTVKEQLIASTELAKKTALKSSAQVQAVTVEVVSSGKATGASVKERIDTIIKSSEQEVHTELEKIDSGLVIEVEHKEADIEVTKPVHKIEETKTEVIKEEVHVKPADDHHVGKIVAGTIVGSGVVAVGAATYVKSSVSSWLTKLKDDVAACIQRGGDQKEVETIVAEANAKIETELKETCKKAESSGASAVVKEQIIASTELTKKTVLESTAQVQAIGVEIITTGGSSVDTLKDRLTGVIESTEKKVHEHVGKVDTSVEIEVEHQKINEIVKHDQGTKVVVGEVTVKPVEKSSKESHDAIITVGAVGYVQATVRSWFAKLMEDVSSRAAKGGKDAQVEIEVIVSEATKKIEGDFAAIAGKTKKSNAELTKTIEWAKGMVVQGSTQVQAIGIQAVSAGTCQKDTIHSQMSPLVEATNTQIDTALTKCDSSVTIEVVQEDKITIVPAGKKTTVVSDKKSDTVQHIVEGALAAGVVGAIAHETIKKTHDKPTTAEDVKQSVDVIEHDDVIIDAVSTEVVEDAGNSISGWFTRLIERLALVLETSVTVQGDLEHVLSEAELEFSGEFAKFKRNAIKARTKDVSSQALDKFFADMHASITSQLTVIRTKLVETQSHESMDRRAMLYGIAAVVSKQISQQVHVVKESSEAVKVDEHVHKQQVSVVKPSKPAYKVDIAKVQAFKAEIHVWYTTLMGQILACYDQDNIDVSKDTAGRVTIAEQELEEIIQSAKSSIKGDSESEKAVSTSIEYVHSMAKSQLSVIKSVATKENVSKTDVKAQLENILLVSSEKIDKAVDMHISKKKSKAHVIVENKEQMQERLQKEVALVAEDCNIKIIGWYETLIDQIRVASRKEGCDIKVEIKTLVEKAMEDLNVIVLESKRKLVSTGNYDIVLGVDMDVASTAAIAQTHALHCFDQIQHTVKNQAFALEHLDVEGVDIEEALKYKVILFKQRIGHSFEYAAGASIAAVFEGKTITWVETTTMPESFAGVRAFAFDLVGTVTDYSTTIRKIWISIIDNHCSKALEKIDIVEFVAKWHATFLERRSATSDKKQLSDVALFRIILIELLKDHGVAENVLTTEELDRLCAAWMKLDLYQDAKSGISRIKKQSLQDTMTVAFSSGFSTRTMVDLARHGCLCWNAQFGADMFAGGKNAESAVQGVADLLALDGPGQLAIVSANPNVLAAAKSLGTRTVHIHRLTHETTTEQFDLEIDGIDMLAESFEAMLETQNAKNQSTSRGWFQRVVDTATDAASAVTRVINY